ncbi:MAG: type II toxin-antitoxin system HicA family toxin [Candidatus Hydrogenedentes bacterium]|nr:type II toxin-antitoxin system HicA family toxin [Candidatus Hydrogenedentota bacterium]
MSPRVRRLTAREVESLLSRFDFRLVSQRGSHRKWRNETTRRQVIVPEHRGKTLPLGTLRNILENSGISQNEWTE